MAGFRFPKLKASTQMIIVSNTVTVVIAVVFYFLLPLVHFSFNFCPHIDRRLDVQDAVIPTQRL